MRQSWWVYPFISDYGATELSQHLKGGRRIKNVTSLRSRYQLNATAISEVTFSYWNSKHLPASYSFVHKISFYYKNLQVSTMIWATYVSFPGSPLAQNRFRLKEAMSLIDNKI